MIQKQLRNSGFTIVELLVVIVIIGILASITIVSYNGIQNRARDVQYSTEAGTIAKKAEIFAATVSGVYPDDPSDFVGDTLTVLPTGIAIAFTTAVEAAVTTAKLSNATAPTSGTNLTYALHENTSTGVKTYIAISCGSGSGLQIFYPVDNTSVESLVVGSGC